MLISLLVLTILFYVTKLDPLFGGDNTYLGVFTEGVCPMLIRSLVDLFSDLLLIKRKRQEHINMLF